VVDPLLASVPLLVDRCRRFARSLSDKGLEHWRVLDVAECLQAPARDADEV